MVEEIEAIRRFGGAIMQHDCRLPPFRIYGLTALWLSSNRIKNLALVILVADRQISAITVPQAPGHVGLQVTRE